MLISKSEFARRMGVSAAAIGKACRSGRLSVIDGRFLDEKVSAIQWDANRKRLPPIKTPRTPALPATPAALDENKRLLDHLAVWIAWRYPSRESNLLDTLEGWLQPIPDRAVLVVELKNMLTVFGENLDRMNEPDDPEEVEFDM